MPTAPRRGAGARPRARALVGAALAWLVGAGCSPAPPSAERVVLVTIDTLRADRVGCYGDATAHTPNLDALATAGVRFVSAVAPTPITLPSHASLLTGLDPHEHGVRSNGRFRLAEEIPTVAERMGEAGFATAAFVASFVLDARFGLARGFDHYDDRIGDGRASRAALSVAERKGDAVVDAALAWLDDAPTRFFLWVHLYDPHADYVPPPRYRRLAGGDAYGGEVAFADAQVGRLLGGVARRFGREGLLLAVTSDHGESLGEHGEPTHGHGLYDATQRVPLLLLGPGLLPGRVVETPVRLVDVGPTLLARAGAAPLGEVTGRDLGPLAAGHDETPRVAYLETLETQLTYGWSPLLGLRTATHKYVRAPRPELYDLTVDPAEEVNRASSEPERVAELDAALEARLAAPGFDAGAATLDEGERARLEALGYLGTGPAPEGTALGVVGGPNPRDRIHELTILMRAALQVRERRGAAALATLRGIQSRDNAYYQELRGRAAVMAREGDTAREAGAWLIAADHRADGLWLRAMGAMIDGDADAARRDLEALRALDPERRGVALNLGRIAEAEGDREGAAARYHEARAAAPDDPLPLAHLAALALGAGRTHEADALLAGRDAAVARSVPASLHLARAEARAGRPDRARRRLEAALARHPDDRRLGDALAALPPASGG